jgi:predicted nucleic acid-binding protein
MQSPDVEIVKLDDQLVDESLKLYSDRTDKAWSWTDCISFVVMSQRGITTALTGDHHFQQAGFQPVFAD